MSLEVPLIITILAIPFYFLSKWLFRKTNIPDRNRKFIAIISALGLSTFLYVSVIVVWISVISYYPTRDFDKEVWQQDKLKRYEMTEDIIDNKMLIGKTRSEVIKLLGNDYSGAIGRRLTYEVGHVPGLFNIDPDFLEIEFENGVVTNVWQHKG